MLRKIKDGAEFCCPSFFSSLIVCYFYRIVVGINFVISINSKSTSSNNELYHSPELQLVSHIFLHYVLSFKCAYNFIFWKGGGWVILSLDRYTYSVNILYFYGSLLYQTMLNFSNLSRQNLNSAIISDTCIYKLVISLLEDFQRRFIYSYMYLKI